MGGLPNEVSPILNRGVVDRRRLIEHIMWVVEWPDHRCGDDLVTTSTEVIRLLYDEATSTVLLDGSVGDFFLPDSESTARMPDISSTGPI